MPLTAMSLLKANQPQTPNGVAVNASTALGLGAGGDNLQDQLDEELKKRRQGLDNNPTAYGAGSLLNAANALFGSMR